MATQGQRAVQAWHAARACTVHVIGHARSMRRPRNLTTRHAYGVREARNRTAQASTNCTTMWCRTRRWVCHVRAAGLCSRARAGNGRRGGPRSSGAARRGLRGGGLEAQVRGRAAQHALQQLHHLRRAQRGRCIRVGLGSA